MKKNKRWSQNLTQNSRALDLEKGVFTWKDPHQIAVSLAKSARKRKRKRKRKSKNIKTTPFRSAVSMVNFYINQAGKKLPLRQKQILGTTKMN